MLISPDVGGVSCEASLSRVDLPQPDGPTIATISRAWTSSVTSSTARVPSGKTFETCSKLSARLVPWPGLECRWLGSSVFGTAGRPSTPTGYMATRRTCVVRGAQRRGASDEERLHLQTLDHSLHVGVTWAGSETFGGVQEARQHLDVASRDDEDAGLTQRPVHRCVDVRLVIEWLVPRRCRALAAHPGSVGQRFDGL